MLDLIKAKRFGLDKFQLVEGGEPAMLAQLAKDYRHKQPIVFLGWEPNPLNVKYKIEYLTGGDDTFGPDFGAANVYTNVRAGYVAACPNVGKLLTQEKFDLAAEDALTDDILDKRMDPARAAATWLRAHKSEVAAWLDGVTTFEGKPGLHAVEGRR